MTRVSGTVGVGRTSALWILSGYALILIAFLGATPLWLDEIQQLGNSWHISAGGLLRWVQLNRGGVPLPYFIQQFFLRLFGYSVLAARLPAALFSVLSGAVFAALCQELKIQRRLACLVLFLFLPLQFRYGLEARGYSQGLFFTVSTLFLFIKLAASPSLRVACVYGVMVALGLYSQPFTLFPVLAQVTGALVFPRFRPTRMYTVIAAGLGALPYLPWYVLRRHAQQTTPESIPVAFSIYQIAPLILLHDLAGGGYICTLALLTLVAWGLSHGWLADPRCQVLLLMGVASIAGPLIADAALGYFFAPRQFLFAMPALGLIAGRGLDALSRKRSWILRSGLLLVFIAAATFKDWRVAVTPKDSLASAADAVAAFSTPDSCVMADPPNEIAYYHFSIRSCVLARNHPARP